MQLALTLRFLLLTVLFGLLIGFSQYLTVWPVVSEFVPEDMIRIMRSQIFYRLLFFALPALFVIAAFSILFTHRIAGPVYRMEQTIERVLTGNETGDFHLRKHDELQELATGINDLLLIVRRPDTPSENRSSG